MRSSNLLQTIDTHTAGCPTRNLHSGFPKIPGSTMQEKQEHFQNNYDWIRTALMEEPRGHVDMAGTIWLPPVHPEADMGVLFIDTVRYLPMCGHSTIGSVTAMVESGCVSVKGDSFPVTLDTPAGLIRTTAHMAQGKVASVSFRNIPSFLFQSGNVNVPGFGKVSYDVAYGGNQYAITDAAQFGLELVPARLDDILKTAVAFARVIREEVSFQHPEHSFIKGISHVEFTAPPRSASATHRNTVVVLPDDLDNGLCAFDRSPCGTGTSARAAAMFEKGEISLNQEFVHESIIGTQFRARIVEAAMVGNFRGGIPEISGQACVTGIHTFCVDEDDPLKHGFLVR